MHLFSMLDHLLSPPVLERERSNNNDRKALVFCFPYSSIERLTYNRRKIRQCKISSSKKLTCKRDFSAGVYQSL
jgi:hypothetical protein